MNKEVVIGQLFNPEVRGVLQALPADQTEAVTAQALTLRDAAVRLEYGTYFYVSPNRFSQEVCYGEALQPILAKYAISNFGIAKTMGYPTLEAADPLEIGEIAELGVSRMRNKVSLRTGLGAPAREHVLPSAHALVSLQAACLGDPELMRSEKALTARSVALDSFALGFLEPVYSRGRPQRDKRESRRYSRNNIRGSF
jgi:hypothetical protein